MKKVVNRVDVVYTCVDNDGNTTKYYEWYTTKRECIARAHELRKRYKYVSISLDMMH